MYKLFIKRLTDIILSFIGIVVLAVPMLFISIAIKIDDPGPVFFTQKRVGQKRTDSLHIFHFTNSEA